MQIKQDRALREHLEEVSDLYSMVSTLGRIKIYSDGDESVFFNRKLLDMWTTYLASSSNKHK